MILVQGLNVRTCVHDSMSRFLIELSNPLRGRNLPASTLVSMVVVCTRLQCQIRTHISPLPRHTHYPIILFRTAPLICLSDRVRWCSRAHCSDTSGTSRRQTVLRFRVTTQRPSLAARCTCAIFRGRNICGCLIGIKWNVVHGLDGLRWHGHGIRIRFLWEFVSKDKWQCPSIRLQSANNIYVWRCVDWRASRATRGVDRHTQWRTKTNCDELIAKTISRCYLIMPAMRMCVCMFSVRSVGKRKLVRIIWRGIYKLHRAHTHTKEKCAVGIHADTRSHAHKCAALSCWAKKGTQSRELNDKCDLMSRKLSSKNNGNGSWNTMEMLT